MPDGSGGRESLSARIFARGIRALARELGTPRLTRQMIASGQYGAARQVPDSGVLVQLAEAGSVDGPLDWVVSLDYDNLASFLSQAPTMPVTLQVDRLIGGIRLQPFVVTVPARAYRWSVRADYVRVSISQTGVGGTGLLAKAGISPTQWAEDTIEDDYSVGIGAVQDFNVPPNAYAFRTLEATAGTDFRQRSAAGVNLVITTAANSRTIVPLMRQAAVLRVFAATTASVGVIQWLRR